MFVEILAAYRCTSWGPGPWGEARAHLLTLLDLPQGLPRDGQPKTVAVYAVFLLVFALLKAWPASAFNNPAFVSVHTTLLEDVHILQYLWAMLAHHCLCACRQKWCPPASAI